MGRRTHKRQHPKKDTPLIEWLPIDSRLLLPIFSFGHVKGIAKVFLTVEMIITIFVVIASMLLFFLKFLL